MGIEDRDWYREAYRNKEKTYGSDFSGKPKLRIVAGRPGRNSTLKTVVIYVVVILAALGLIMLLKSPSVAALLKRLGK